jgi:ribosomal protein S19E (S16A)
MTLQERQIRAENRRSMLKTRLQQERPPTAKALWYALKAAGVAVSYLTVLSDLRKLNVTLKRKKGIVYEE